MKVSYKLIENLPPLVWAAFCNNGNIEVIHGKNVECKENFFVEGAWDGLFNEGGFCRSEWFCGTGASVTDEKIMFSTPTHIAHGLYSTKLKYSEYSENSGGGYCLSNSLYFLLALNKYKLDPQYLYYETDFNTLLFGIHKYKEDIHVLNAMNNPVTVQVHYFRNIEITSNNELYIHTKSKVRDFQNYNDYYERLLSAMDELYKNARDVNRMNQYGIVTTISKGYDAPCCAAIAKKIGCNTAVTFKAEGKHKDDSGMEIAQKLGYQNIIEKDADAYKKRNDFVEALFIASGELGASISSSAFENEFSGNLVLSGERGDRIWNKNALQVNNEFCFDDMVSELGKSEYRLWNNYISIPMPQYGATSWTSLHRISNSEEMKKYQLNNNYDRPIPRRILEESGIDRESFGQHKHGAGFIYRYDWLGRIKSRMSDASATSFESYVKENKSRSILLKIKYFWKTKELYLSRLGISVKTKKLVEYSQIANPMATRYLIPWAGDVVLQKYKNILGE